MELHGLKTYSELHKRSWGNGRWLDALFVGQETLHKDVAVALPQVLLALISKE